MCSRSKICRALFTWLIILLAAAGCAPVNEQVRVTGEPPATAVPPSITPSPILATPAPTAVPTMVVETPAVEATAVPTPTPSLLGEPLSLGRGRIVDAAFTPDGTAVAIAWANGVSLATIAGQEVWWRPFTVPVIALDVHPNGEAVAAARGDGSIVVIEAATGDWQRFDGARPNAYIGDIAWSSDGQAITLASLGSRCGQIVAAESGETLFTLADGDDCFAAHTVAWSPDGRYLASLAAGGTIKVWSLTGE